MLPDITYIIPSSEITSRLSVPLWQGNRWDHNPYAGLQPAVQESKPFSGGSNQHPIFPASNRDAVVPTLTKLEFFAVGLLVVKLVRALLFGLLFEFLRSFGEFW